MLHALHDILSNVHADATSQRVGIDDAFMLNYSDEEGAMPSVAPTLAVRLGYSEGWSRVSRRFFVVLEPKARWVRGGPELLCSVVIGQGRGR